jgi:hypothetical protein
MNPVATFPIKYIRLPLFEAVTGYTEKAVRRKIEDGVWLQDKEFKCAPDGHILIALEGYHKWVENSNSRGSCR